jgi:hypothetical protein
VQTFLFIIWEAKVYSPVTRPNFWPTLTLFKTDVFANLSSLLKHINFGFESVSEVMSLSFLYFRVPSRTQSVGDPSTRF